MAAHRKHRTYLRVYRRRAGLSQEDVAYLLGIQARTGVSRHELADSIPVLEVLLAYEAIYGACTGDLYKGLRQQVVQDTTLRAQGLIKRLQLRPQSKERDRKIAFLARVVSGDVLQA